MARVPFNLLAGVNTFRAIPDHPDARMYPENKTGTIKQVWRWVKESQARGAGIYFNVNKMRPGCTTADGVQHHRAFFTEVDCGTSIDEKSDTLSSLLSSRLTPSAIVETKNGFHVYWYRAGNGIDPDLYKRTNISIVHYFGGDAAVMDSGRVLRVPLTLHLKDPLDPFLVKTVHDDNRKYTDEQVWEVFKPAPERKIAKVGIKHDPVEWSRVLLALAQHNPDKGQRNKTMLLALGVAKHLGVSRGSAIAELEPIYKSWNVGRDVASELVRISEWAFERQPLHPKVLRNVGLQM